MPFPVLKMCQINFGSHPGRAFESATIRHPTRHQFCVALYSNKRPLPDETRMKKSTKQTCWSSYLLPEDMRQSAGVTGKCHLVTITFLHCDLLHTPLAKNTSRLHHLSEFNSSTIKVSLANIISLTPVGKDFGACVVRAALRGVWRESRGWRTGCVTWSIWTMYVARCHLNRLDV